MTYREEVVVIMVKMKSGEKIPVTVDRSMGHSQTVDFLDKEYGNKWVSWSVRN